LGLLERIQEVRQPEVRSITSIDDYIGALSQFQFQGNSYSYGSNVQQTLGSEPAERIPNDLVGYATAAYAANGPIFACMLVRQLVFSAVRFQWQALVDGKPAKLFGTPELRALERPWTGGTTQDLLNKTIQYADLAGNSFAIRDTSFARMDGDGQSEIVPLRPDWMQIVLKPRMLDAGNGKTGPAGWRRIGYLYTENGYQSGNESVPFLLNEVSHFAPIPDPLASYRGMSWLTPVIREISNDKLMLRHQQKFFENGATVNMVVKVDKDVKVEDFKKFKAIMEAEHVGIENAYKMLFLGGGADATVVGSNFEQMTFTDLVGASETRIASAAGVPPIIAGFSKGLESATYSNYGQARRRFADGTMHPLWQNATGSFEPLLTLPPGGPSRLWYDASGVPFLREDEKDSAEIQFRLAQTIRQYTDAGFTWESAVAAVEANDRRLLEHTGLYSVQLQPPGTVFTPTQKQLPAGGNTDE
jgi:phage portal protein BeeE